MPIFKGEAGAWVLSGICIAITYIFLAIVHRWNEKHPIKVEPKDPDGWPYYIDRNTGTMYCKPAEIIMSKKFQRESEEISRLIKKHNGTLPFVD